VPSTDERAPQPRNLAADPRPQVLDGRLVGAHCPTCGFSVAPATPRCPACGTATVARRVATVGTVWSATTVRVPTVWAPAPSALAYVDVDDGPRLLMRADPEAPPAIGSRVTFTERDGVLWCSATSADPAAERGDR